ncbi:IS5/IS1182 family transposase, partial [Ruegeria sp. 2012CJ15-1]
MSNLSSTRYRTMNWSDYNAGLKKRGSLLIWLDND